MDKLAQYKPDKVIDILNERLTFERAGVKLYDAIIAKMRSTSDPQITKLVDRMMEYRDEEKEHEEWLEEQIRALGGDAHARTEHSMLIERESVGIEQVILDGDPQIDHLFHALLSAELVDNAGWDLLVELADEAGDADARRAFKKRLHDEEEHLRFVKKVVETFARRDILDVGVRMSVSP